ncbi:hypothetical protein D1007_35979 [Hordeum vulgare]|nr:hypothetical protein D1007_35979 [Hordeum vulgare]
MERDWTAREASRRWLQISSGSNSGDARRSMTESLCDAIEHGCVATTFAEHTDEEGHAAAAGARGVPSGAESKRVAAAAVAEPLPELWPALSVSYRRGEVAKLPAALRIGSRHKSNGHCAATAEIDEGGSCALSYVWSEFNSDSLSHVEVSSSLVAGEMPKLLPDSWEGSVITEAHIDYLRQTGKLSSEELVEARAPGEEIVQEPRPGGRLIFGTHFLVGFGLPGSIFLRQFLELYGLEMHHLGPNCVLYLACFATLCEAYLGFLPFPSFCRHLFHLCAQTHHHGPYSCGGVVVYKLFGRLLPRMTFKESFKK